MSEYPFQAFVSSLPACARDSLDEFEDGIGTGSVAKDGEQWSVKSPAELFRSDTTARRRESGMNPVMVWWISVKNLTLQRSETTLKPIRQPG